MSVEKTRTYTSVKLILTRFWDFFLAAECHSSFRVLRGLPYCSMLYNYCCISCKRKASAQMKKLLVFPSHGCVCSSSPDRANIVNVIWSKQAATPPLHHSAQTDAPAFTRGGMWPLCICPLVMCCLAWGMEPIWKLSGPPAPERMMAGRATEPVSTFPILLNCCCSTVDLEPQHKHTFGLKRVL